LALLLPALAAAQPAPAADKPDSPSVAALLAACERGLAARNTGVDAALCEWYAVPCDCKLTRDADLPRWCMPADEPIERAMRRVVAGLRAHPEPGAAAEPAVAGILARLYPCD
jgi:ribosomal protein S12 methylthiotransferase accessory factor YcaO